MSGLSLRGDLNKIRAAGGSAQRLGQIAEEAKAAHASGDREKLRALRDEYSKMRMFAWMVMSVAPQQEHTDAAETLLNINEPTVVVDADKIIEKEPK